MSLWPLEKVSDYSKAAACLGPVDTQNLFKKYCISGWGWLTTTGIFSGGAQAVLLIVAKRASCRELSRTAMSMPLAISEFGRAESQGVNWVE